MPTPTFCPYGVYFLTPALISILSMILTFKVAFDCHFFKTTTEGTSLGIEVTKNIDFSVGAWTVENFKINENGVPVGSDNCVMWQDHDTLGRSDLDVPLIFSRVTSLVTFLVALILWLDLMLGGCFALFRPNLLKMMTVVFFIVGFFLMAPMVSLASEWCRDATDCHLDWSGIQSIVGFFMWLATSISVMYLGHARSNVWSPALDPMDHHHQDEETYDPADPEQPIQAVVDKPEADVTVDDSENVDQRMDEGGEDRFLDDDSDDQEEEEEEVGGVRVENL